MTWAALKLCFESPSAVTLILMKSKKIFDIYKNSFFETWIFLLHKEEWFSIDCIIDPNYSLSHQPQPQLK